MYAVKFGEPELPALRAGQRRTARCSTTATRATGCEKVAPVADHRRRPLPGGRGRPDRSGSSTATPPPTGTRRRERESFKTMTDDSLQDTTGLRTLPTDEINYMRNAVKATVDAYDGTVTLYAWDETDPILQAWQQRVPRHGAAARRRSPTTLLDHLRYPEDLFKVQRYQFARYHVTDAERLLPGQQPLGRSRRTRTAKGHLQPPYRLFVDQPTDTGATTQHVLADVGVHAVQARTTWRRSSRSTPTRPRRRYGQMRVLQLPDQHDAGSGPDRQRVRLEQRRAPDSSQPFQPGGAPPIFGNLLTLPVADGLIYVEPVYAVRAGSTSGYPILQLRAGVLRRRGRHRHDPGRRARRRARRRRAARPTPQATAARAATAAATSDGHRQRADPRAAGQRRARVRAADAALAKQRHRDLGPADRARSGVRGRGARARQRGAAGPTSGTRRAPADARLPAGRASSSPRICGAPAHPVRLCSPTRGGAAR